MGAFRDHPRIRGEQALWVNSVSVFLGSPPHTRGAALFRPVGSGDRGITPAYAGSRFRIVVRQSQSVGSPPHTRGAVDPKGKQHWLGGITPAYAGSSCLV